MKGTAILTITIWFAALTGVVAFAYLSTQPAWSEIAERMTHHAPTITHEPIVQAAIATTISTLDRERLTNGLASLQTSLETYQEKILEGGN